MMIYKSSLSDIGLDKYYKNPELLFEHTTFHFKSKFKGKRMAVVKLGNSHFVAQEFRNSGWKRLLHLFPFRATKAFRAWFYGHKLSANKIRCAKPLLVIEKRLGPFRSSSYLLVHYITGLIGSEYFDSVSAFRECWPSTIKNIHRLLHKLETLQINHSEFGLNSFMVKDNESYLIDLENIRSHKPRSLLPKKKISHKHFSSLKEEVAKCNSSAYDLFHQSSLKKP